MENEWRFIGFYGELETSRRWEAWDQLRHLNSNSRVLWICMGDFNEITKQDENFGGVAQSHNQRQLF